MATVFVNCGTAWLSRLLDGTNVRTTYYVGWGEATGTTSKGQFVVNSEVQAREQAPSSQTAFNQVQWTATMTATAVRSITQAGLFATNSGPLQQNDRISFTFTLTST